MIIPTGSMAGPSPGSAEPWVQGLHAAWFLEQRFPHGAG